MRLLYYYLYFLISEICFSSNNLITKKTYEWGSVPYYWYDPLQFKMYRNCYNHYHNNTRKQSFKYRDSLIEFKVKSNYLFIYLLLCNFI